MSPFVVLVPGHGHRSDGLRWDPGASIGDIQEAKMVRRLALALAGELLRLGASFCPPALTDAPSILITGKPHPLRHYSGRVEAGVREAKKAGAETVLVLHLHLNAGGGKYGLVVHDARAPTEKDIAAPLVAAIKKWGGAAMSECKNADDAMFSRARGLHDATWSGAKNSGLKVSSLVLEPAFIDQPLHNGLVSDAGMDTLAKHLAESLAEKRA